MRITTTLMAAASVAVLSTSAFAGGMAPIVADTPVVEPMMEPAGSSINSTYVVIGVLAALVIAAAVAAEDE